MIDPYEAEQLANEARVDKAEEKRRLFNYFKHPNPQDPDFEETEE